MDSGGGRKYNQVKILDYQDVTNYGGAGGQGGQPVTWVVEQVVVLECRWLMQSSIQDGGDGQLIHSYLSRTAVVHGYAMVLFNQLWWNCMERCIRT